MIVNFRQISGILILNTLGWVPRQGFFKNFFQGLGGLGFRARIRVRPGSLPPGAGNVLPGQGPARQAHSLETDRHFSTSEASRILTGGTSHRYSGRRGFRPGKGRRRCRTGEFQHPAGALVLGDTHPPRLPCGLPAAGCLASLGSPPAMIHCPSGTANPMACERGTTPLAVEENSPSQASRKSP